MTEATPRLIFRGEYVVDEVEDAYGNLTIRVADGTPNGDTEQQPIATVYSAEHADLIVKAVNSHDGLVAALGLAYESLSGMGEQTEAASAAAYDALGLHRRYRQAAKQ